MKQKKEAGKRTERNKEKGQEEESKKESCL